jgi:hypothetical protein
MSVTGLIKILGNTMGAIFFFFFFFFVKQSTAKDVTDFFITAALLTNQCLKNIYLHFALLTKLSFDNEIHLFTVKAYLSLQFLRITKGSKKHIKFGGCSGQP